MKYFLVDFQVDDIGYHRRVSVSSELFYIIINNFSCLYRIEKVTFCHSIYYYIFTGSCYFLLGVRIYEKTR